MKVVLIVALLSTGAGVSVYSQTQSIIGAFETTQQIEQELDGCACRIGNLFISSADGRVAWMKIAGRIERLQSTSRGNTGGIPDVFSRRYSGNHIIVKVLFHRVKVFSPPDQNSESEAVKLRATIMVQKGRTKETVEASGSCGC